MPTALFTVKATITPDREKAFNEWYNREHVPDVGAWRRNLQSAPHVGDLARQRQGFAGRQHIERRGTGRQQHEVRQQGGQQRRIGKTGRRIDEDAGGGLGGGAHSRLEALWVGGLDGGDAGGKEAGAQPGPGHQTLLRVGVEHGHGLA